MAKRGVGTTILLPYEVVNKTYKNVEKAKIATKSVDFVA